MARKKDVLVPLYCISYILTMDFRYLSFKYKCVETLDLSKDFFEELIPIFGSILMTSRNGMAALVVSIQFLSNKETVTVHNYIPTYQRNYLLLYIIW